MFAIGRVKVAAVALVGCWLLTIAVDVVLVELAPARLVPASLAIGNTVGQLVVAVPLLLVTRRICGRAAVQGARHAALAGLAAGAAGAVVGAGICLAIPDTGKLLDAAVAVVAAAFSVITFGSVAYALDRGDLKTVVTRLRRGRRPAPPAAEEP